MLFFLRIADEEQTENSNVKITQNEACVLQNQVRQYIKDFIIIAHDF